MAWCQRPRAVRRAEREEKVIIVADIMITLLGLVFLPGFLMLLLARVRVDLAAVGAIPASFGVVTIASYVFDKLGIAWNLATYLAAAVIIGAVMALVALIAARPWRRRERHTTQSLFPGAGLRTAARTQWRSWVWFVVPAVAVCASAWAIGTMILNELVTGTGGVGNIFQGWDAHWHVNYLRFIAETGIASPDQAGLLRNPESGATLYYPSSWHAISGLVYSITGASAPTVYNIVQIGGQALYFPLGVASLAFAMSRRRFGLPAAATAATLGALLTPLFPSLPFVEIMVAATPSAASMGLVGVVVLLIIAAVRRPVLILPAALALIGVGGVHPSGLATAAVIIIFYWLFELLWRPERGRFKDILPLAAIAILGALTLVPQLLTISSEADDISAFEFQTGDSRGVAWAKAAALQVRHVSDWGVRWVLLVIILLGAIALLYRLVVWPVLLWAGYLLVCVNAMNVFGNSSGGWLRAVGSIYYNDPRRVGVVMAVLCAAAAGVGIAAIAQGIVAWLGKLSDPVTDPQRRGFAGLRVAAALSAVIAVSSWAIQTAPEYAVAAGNNQRWGVLVDTHDLDAFTWLSTQPKAYDGMIFVNPDEGSGWMYATNGLPSTARHYLVPPDDEKNIWTLMGFINRAGASENVDRAIAELGVNYVYFSPGSYWPWQKTLPQYIDAVNAPGLALVYVDRQVRIYAVRAAFTQAELDQIIADSPHRPDMPQSFTRASEHGY